MHLTLRFIGEVNESDIPALCRALEEVSSAAAPFRLISGNLGAFPSMRAPRSLWLGLESSAELHSLRAQMERALFNIGLQREKKNFNPHLTLCRLRSRESSRAISQAARGLKVEKKVAFVVKRFVLYKSILAPQGAVHSLIREFPLTGT